MQLIKSRLIWIVIICILVLSNIAVWRSPNLKKENERLEKQVIDLNIQLTQTKLEDKTVFNNIKDKILILSPKLNDITATNYSLLIEEYCIPETHIFMVAVFQQETGFNTTAINDNDYGLGQINWKTWHKFFNLNNKEQLFDPALNIKISCKVLEMAYITHREKDNWWGYYHSWSSAPREKYVKMVTRYLEKIGG